MEAIRALQADIRSLGSALVLRVGAVGKVLPKVVKEVGASSVYLEVEAQHRWVGECLFWGRHKI